MWPNPQFPADLVTFTEEIPNGKFYFLCSDIYDVALYSRQLTVSGQLFLQKSSIVDVWQGSKYVWKRVSS